MKAKQLMLKTLRAAAFTGGFLTSSAVLAQVKIGSNPTVISANANLDIQSTNGNRMVVLKDNGFAGIGTLAPTNLLTLGPVFGGNITAVAGKKLAVYQAAAGDDFYGLGVNPGVLQFHAASLPDEAPAMVLTGAGSVGIGTTGPISRLHVNETAEAVFGSTIAAFGRPGNKLLFFETSATLGAYNGLVKEGDAHVIFSPDGDPYNAGNTGLVIAPWSTSTSSPGLKIMENGNIGIGTATPPAKLSVFGGLAYFGTDPAPSIAALTSGTSTSDGIIFQNQNGAVSDGAIVVQRSGAANYSPMYITRNATLGSGSGFLTTYLVNGTLVGSVSTNGATTAFNTSSDARLKENIKKTRYGLTELMAIKVSDYNYRHDKSKTEVTGFLAQDLHKVYPGAVTVGGENAQTDPWTVDYGKLTPLLVKAVQEQQDQITTLKQENMQFRRQTSEMNALHSSLKKQLDAVESLAAKLEQMEAKLEATLSKDGSITTGR